MSDDRYQIPYGDRLPPLIGERARQFEKPRDHAEKLQKPATPQQPVVAPPEEIAETKVSCHLSDALASLCDALQECREQPVVDRIITALDAVKSAQLEVYKSGKENAEDV